MVAGDEAKEISNTHFEEWINDTEFTPDTHLPPPPPPLFWHSSCTIVDQWMMVDIEKAQNLGKKRVGVASSQLQKMAKTTNKLTRDGRAQESGEQTTNRATQKKHYFGLFNKFTLHTSLNTTWRENMPNYSCQSFFIQGGQECGARSPR